MPALDPSSTPGGQNNTYLQRAYNLDSVSSARDLYNEWAAAYDSDVQGQEYASPQATIQTLLKHWPEDCGTRDVEILDAGCGTGLVGKVLANEAIKGKEHWKMDGVDLTQGMLDIAVQKHLYRKLWTADLNERLDVEAGTYNALTCVGTLTKGHVGPGCLGEFVRVIRSGGVVVATIHDEIWESLGYKAEVERLEKEAKVEVLETDEFGIIKGETRGGRMVVLRRKGVRRE